MQAGMSGAQEAVEGPPAEELDAYTIATWIDEDVAVQAYDAGVEPSVDLLSQVVPYYDGLVPTSLDVTAVGDRVQVTVDSESVCLTLSPDGFGENIADGPC